MSVFTLCLLEIRARHISPSEADEQRRVSESIDEELEPFEVPFTDLEKDEKPVTTLNEQCKRFVNHYRSVLSKLPSKTAFILFASLSETFFLHIGFKYFQVLLPNIKYCHL